ncbi:MAG TPA: AidA/PixA family protein [Burkholderiaceae bacterium]
MTTYVEIAISNNAGSNTPIADPYISMVGTVNGAKVNFSIAADGVCTPNGSGSPVRQLSALTGPLQLDSSLVVTGGRIYFSSSGAAITPQGVDPTTADFYYDWIEFSLNSGAAQQLVVNTTQADQFGFPIALDIYPPDPSFGATAGVKMARTSILTHFQQKLEAVYQDCLFGNGNGGFYRILSPNMALVKNPASSLGTVFTQATDELFTYYSQNALYLNSDRAYPYTGTVTTSTEMGSDGKMHDYSVLQFNFSSNAPINPGVPSTPPEGVGPYNIYYPFFSTNNPAGHKTFNGNPPPPPPQWWTTSGNAPGRLNPSESPSQMVFACNGVFADDLYQLNISAPTPQANVLGNLENQVATALNRGYAQSWFTLTGSIAPSVRNPTTGLYTSVVTLQTAYEDQDSPNTTDNLTVGMNVLSFSSGIPLQVSKITSDTTFNVTSEQEILPQNDLYLSFSKFYPSGATFNAYAKFFHQPAVSIGGRAYAFPFDDQGGFSSTLTSNWTSAPSKLTVTLAPWEASTADIVCVIDANTIMQAVAAGKLAAGTATAPTSLGSWKESDQYIFMIADGSYVSNDQGKSELTLDCSVGDQVRWSITNPSADFTYNCLLYNFVPNKTGIISPPQPVTKTVTTYCNTPGNPTVPAASTMTMTVWTANVESVGSVQYSWAFMIVDNATGETVGYFFWDPFIKVTA